jgi:hypothetical protein
LSVPAMTPMGSETHITCCFDYRAQRESNSVSVVKVRTVT